MKRRVIKIGGSLLNDPELPSRLLNWLASLMPEQTILIVGGGELVDVIRLWHDRFDLRETTSHELACRALSVTASLVHSWLPDAILIDDLTKLEKHQTIVFSCTDSILRSDAPANWDFTSDSIAAQTALKCEAEELILLKSILPSTDRLDLAAEQNYVDACFCQLAKAIPIVSACVLSGERVGFSVITEPQESKMKNQQSDRRDFLKGRSMVRAARQALENFEFSVPDINIDASEKRQAAYLESYEKSAMACTWELMFNMHQHRQSAFAASKAMTLIDSLESQLTVYRDDSEVSRLNQNAFSNPVSVEENLFELLQLAQQIYVDTDGAFDVTSGQLTSLWGFEQRSGGVPEETQIAETLALTGTDKIMLDDENETVRFQVEGLKVNLGGIGKGYAIDRVAELIRQHEVGDFLIHGGQSSVLAAGNQKNLDRETPDSESSPTSANGWPVGLSHPTLPDRRLAEFRLIDAALGTSGTARQGFFHKGKRYGHIIHPKTGWPTSHFLSTTVISPSAAVSDALATAFFVMPIDAIEEFCRKRTDIAAVLVSQAEGKGESNVQLDWFNLDDDQWRRL